MNIFETSYTQYILRLKSRSLRHEDISHPYLRQSIILAQKLFDNLSCIICSADDSDVAPSQLEIASLEKNDFIPTWQSLSPTSSFCVSIGSASVPKIELILTQLNKLFRTFSESGCDWLQVPKQVNPPLTVSQVIWEAFPFTPSDLSVADFKEGLRDNLICWAKDDQKILVDGFSRYLICLAHDIPYDDKITYCNYPDWQTAQQERIKYNLNRRHFNNQTRNYLIGKIYNQSKETAPIIDRYKISRSQVFLSEEYYLAIATIESKISNYWENQKEKNFINKFQELWFAGAIKSNRIILNQIKELEPEILAGIIETALSTKEIVLPRNLDFRVGERIKICPSKGSRDLDKYSGESGIIIKVNPSGTLLIETENKKNVILLTKDVVKIPLGDINCLKASEISFTEKEKPLSTSVGQGLSARSSSLGTKTTDLRENLLFSPITVNKRDLETKITSKTVDPPESSVTKTESRLHYSDMLEEDPSLSISLDQALETIAASAQNLTPSQIKFLENIVSQARIV